MAKGRHQKREVTCIVCPIGCKITVDVAGTEIIGISGNTCPRGKEHAKNEILDPRRTLTSSVLVVGGDWPLASVRTSKPVPKGSIVNVMSAIRSKNVKAPVKVGDVIITDVAGTGADIIATRNVRMAWPKRLEKRKRK